MLQSGVRHKRVLEFSKTVSHTWESESSLGLELAGRSQPNDQPDGCYVKKVNDASLPREIKAGLVLMQVNNTAHLEGYSYDQLVELINGTSRPTTIVFGKLCDGIPLIESEAVESHPEERLRRIGSVYHNTVGSKRMALVRVLYFIIKLLGTLCFIFMSIS